MFYSMEAGVDMTMLIEKLVNTKDRQSKRTKGNGLWIYKSTTMRYMVIHDAKPHYFQSSRSSELNVHSNNIFSQTICCSKHDWHIVLVDWRPNQPNCQELGYSSSSKQWYMRTDGLCLNMYSILVIASLFPLEKLIANGQLLLF